MSRIAAMGLAAASAMLALPAAAQTCDAPPAGTAAAAAVRPSFDPAAPRWAALNALRARAQDATDDAARAAAWQALSDAAGRTRVDAAGTVHPLAGIALAATASAQEARGDTAGAVATWRRALAILAPYRDVYAPDYASTVAAPARALTSTLGKGREALALLGQCDRWYDAYLAKLPPDRRTARDVTGETDLLLAYAEVLGDLDRYGESVEYKRRYWEAMKRAKGPYHPDTNTGEWSYATELFLAGKSEEAEFHAREAVQIAIDHIGPAEPTFAQSFNALAILLARRGKRFEALDYIQRSIELRRGAMASDDLRFLPSLYNLGDVLTALERYDEAERAMLEAARGWRAKEGASSIKASMAFARAGIAEYAEGRVAEAADHLNAALASARAADPNEQRVGTLAQPVLNLAGAELGHADDARRLADGNVAYLRSVPQPYPIELAVAELTAAYLAPGGTGSAASRAAARRVVEIERSGRDIVASGDLAQGDRTAMEIALRVAAAANDAQLALDAMVVLAGSKIAQANRLVADRLVTADPALAARIRAQQDAARAFKTADTALLKAMAAGTDVAAAKRQHDDAAARVAALRAALAADYPDWTDASGVADPDLAQVQAGLGPTEAILMIVPAFDGVFTLTVTRAEARVRRTPLGRRAVTDLVATLRGSLFLGGFDAASAQALHEQFFPRADARMLARVTSLRIVPAGVFAALPFAALLTRPVGTLDARAPYLIRRFAITIAPGIVPAAPRPADRPAARGDARFLGVGAPTRESAAGASKLLAARAYFRGGPGGAAALAGLPPLPGSAEEIARVARDFGPAHAQLLIGDDASEARLKATDLKRFSTILFATHGLVSGEVEGLTEPALVLARPSGDNRAPGDDGLLTASEIAALTLDADWVILSACNTAAGDRLEAPAYSGLAQAFRYAGARTLLLSHWPIRDDAAAAVTVDTIANARRGMRRDVALQRAMLKLMASRTVPGAADPFVWAPYILLGETG